MQPQGVGRKHLRKKATEEYTVQERRLRASNNRGITEKRDSRHNVSHGPVLQWQGNEAKREIYRDIRVLCRGQGRKVPSPRCFCFKNKNILL